MFHNTAFEKGTSLADKVALITAAGSGMGAATARRLANLDYKVAILSSSGRGEAFATDLGGVGITGSNQVPADLKRVVETAMDSFGGIDAVVNSASHGLQGKILEISDDDWHVAMDVYLLNVVRIARLVTPILQSRGGGTIVNISTFATFETYVKVEQPGFHTKNIIVVTTLLNADEFTKSDLARMYRARWNKEAYQSGYT